MVIDMNGRYLFFVFDHYYPYGGSNDLVLRTSNVKEIYNSIKRLDFEYEGIAIYDIIDNKNINFECDNCSSDLNIEYYDGIGIILTCKHYGDCECCEKIVLKTIEV